MRSLVPLSPTSSPPLDVHICELGHILITNIRSPTWMCLMYLLVKPKANSKRVHTRQHLFRLFVCLIDWLCMYVHVYVKWGSDFIEFVVILHAYATRNAIKGPTQCEISLIMFLRCTTLLLTKQWIQLMGTCYLLKTCMITLDGKESSNNFIQWFNLIM